jgi:hypothetical protein
MSRGEDDEVSDMDLWVQADDWSPEPVFCRLVALQRLTLGGNEFLHGVDLDGTIVDIMHGPQVPSWYTPLELPLGEQCEGEEPGEFGLIEEFWITTLKHRKSLWRGKPAIAAFGLQFDRKNLMRAWSVADGGEDPGDAAFNFFSLTALTDRVINRDRLALLGMPLRNAEEIEAAVLANRDEMSRMFPPATRLESIVRRLPPRGA